MFRFGEPQYLYLLIVLPLLAVFYFYSNYRRRKKLREYGSPELLAHLMPDVSKYRPDVKILADAFCAGHGYFHAGSSAVRFKDGNGEASGCGNGGGTGYFKLYAGTGCHS